MKNDSIEKHVIQLSHYKIDSKDTVRGAAKKFELSKNNYNKELQYF